MIKKILFIFVIIFLGVFFSTAQCNPTDTFKLGVSLIEEVPQMLFGAWRVSSELIETDSPEKFKKTSTDIWNLSKHGDVIKLSNPFSGASATVKLEYVKQNRIKFTKKHNYDGQILTDTVELYLEKDSFSGVNTILLETLSDVDNTVIKSSRAMYNLKGDKIAGENITDANI